VATGIFTVYAVFSIVRCSIKKYQFPDAVVSESEYDEVFREIFQIRDENDELPPLSGWAKFNIEYFLTSVSPDEIITYIQENQYTTNYGRWDYEEFDAVLIGWNTCDELYILTIAPASEAGQYSLTLESYTPNDSLIQRLFDCLIPKNPQTCKKFW
jgi:hypothetical protein